MVSAAGVGITVAVLHGAVGALAESSPVGNSALALNVQTWTATPVPGEAPKPSSSVPSSPAPASPGAATPKPARAATPKPARSRTAATVPPPTIDPARAWARPLTKPRFTSQFGSRWGTQHNGIDLAAPAGTPIVAMSTGRVTFAGWQGGFGKKVEIRYWDGTVSSYGHLNRIDVLAGDAVAPGTAVGTVGNTGNSTGPHLHLEIHPKGAKKPVNPEPWLTRHGLSAR